MPAAGTVAPETPLAHMIRRLSSAEILPEPYPHFYLKDVFPESYYLEMLRHMPGGSVYQNLYAVTDLKLDHFKHRDQRDMSEGWTELLPLEIRPFWEDFTRWFMGPELARAVLDTFAEPLRQQFGGRPLPDTSVEAHFIRHRAGYFLGPHSDLFSKLVVLLIYLPPDESSAHLGTSLYRPKDPGFSCPNSTHYPFEHFVRVKTVPYLPNSMLAFQRSDRSFHGVEPLSDKDATGTASPASRGIQPAPPGGSGSASTARRSILPAPPGGPGSASPAGGPGSASPARRGILPAPVSAGGRDLIQYVLYDKPVREQQLKARREASARGTSQ
jgi:hypothetical protein